MASQTSDSASPIMSAASSGSPLSKNTPTPGRPRSGTLPRPIEKERWGVVRCSPTMPRESGRCGRMDIGWTRGGGRRATSYLQRWARRQCGGADVQDWAEYNATRAITEFDVQHQISRLRLAKKMGDSEAEAIFSALAQTVRSYEQIVEVSISLEYRADATAVDFPATTLGRAHAGREWPVPSMADRKGTYVGTTRNAAAIPSASIMSRAR